jgi:hypothetical protein
MAYQLLIDLVRQKNGSHILDCIVLVFLFQKGNSPVVQAIVKRHNGKKSPSVKSHFKHIFYLL